MQTDAHTSTQTDTLPANVNTPLDAYKKTLDEQAGFVDDQSPLRPRRYRMPLAALVLGALTIATLFGGIGYAIGAAIASA